MTAPPPVTAELLRGWAVDALGEWLPGYISADGGQYRIRQLAGYPCVDQTGGVFQVEAADHWGGGPHRFVVAVSVVAVAVSDVTGAAS